MLGAFKVTGNNIFTITTDNVIPIQAWSLAWWEKFDATKVNALSGTGYQWSILCQNEQNHQILGFIVPNAGKIPYIHNQRTINGTTSQAYLGGDIKLNDNTNALDNKWHHYVYTYDWTNREQKLYIDGILFKTVATSENNPNNEYLKKINLSETNIGPSFWDVRVYNHVLNANEVTSLAKLPKGLLAWFPLNGSIKNQGLLNLNVTVDGGEQWDTTHSKFGSISYKPDGTHHLITTLSGLSRDNWTVAAWLYITQTSSTGHLYAVSINGTTSDDFLVSLCYYNGWSLRCGNNTYALQNVTQGANEWIHMCATYDGTTLKGYINGELKLNQTTQKPVQTSTLTIGRRNTSSCDWYGNINDVRVYNYVLKDSEIQKIVQGLVCHYTFERSTNLLTNGAGIKEETRGSGNVFIDYSYDNALTTMPSGSYTISFDSKTDNDVSNVDFYFRNNAGAATYATTTVALTQEWQHFMKTFNGDPSVLGICRFRAQAGSGKFYIRNAQLEYGNAATPFKPHPDDCNSLRKNYDGSGLFKIGTYANNTNVKTNYDSVRYCNSAQGNNIQVTHDRVLSNDLQEWTVCAWLKMTDTNIKVLNNFNLGCRIYHSNGGNALLYLNSGGTTNDYYNYSNMVVPINSWVHLAFVFQNSSGTKLIYINGEDRTNTTGPNRTSTPFGIADIVILFETFDGSVNDYREYCTALSATNILNLYNMKHPS